MGQKKDERNRAMLEMYQTDRYSMAEIGVKFNVSRQRVYQILSKYGISSREDTIERRAMQVYDYIVEYKIEHGGVSPSAVDILKNCSKIGNADNLSGAISWLERNGVIDWATKNRTYRALILVGGVWTPPSIEHKKDSNGQNTNVSKGAVHIRNTRGIEG